MQQYQKHIPTLDKTKPADISSSSTPDNLILRFSPGPARLTLSSSANIARTLTGSWWLASKISIYATMNVYRYKQEME